MKYFPLINNTYNKMKLKNNFLKHKLNNLQNYLKNQSHF